MPPLPSMLWSGSGAGFSDFAAGEDSGESAADTGIPAAPETNAMSANACPALAALRRPAVWIGLYSVFISVSCSWAILRRSGRARSNFLVVLRLPSVVRQPCSSVP